jgi:hypothetical protein
MTVLAGADVVAIPSGEEIEFEPSTAVLNFDIALAVDSRELGVGGA